MPGWPPIRSRPRDPVVRRDSWVHDVLAAWGQLTVTGRVSEGSRNEVLELRHGGQRLAARRSRRQPSSLDWEIGLLDHLAGHGFRVPAAVPSLDGRRHIGGVVVQSWLDGSPPGPGDWPAVAAELRRLHQVTAGWPQRPGFPSTRELLTADGGGDVDLTAMPAGAVAACRRAWARLDGAPEAVVHGDPGPSNIRVTEAGVGLLDWDEARVDYVDLDLAELPFADLPSARLSAARTAVTAWEAASGWMVEPSYARRRLAMLAAAQGDDVSQDPDAGPGS
jgi:Ser/Thr protein kinase RdoA (MazF antagonist)